MELYSWVVKTSASGENGSEMRDSNSHHKGNVGPYANEPVADEDRLANYRKKKANKRRTAQETTTEA